MRQYMPIWKKNIKAHITGRNLVNMARVKQEKLPTQLQHILLIVNY